MRCERIGATKGEAFYRGEIAQAIAAWSREHGGAMTAADLAAYQPEWVAPLAQDYRGHTLHEIPPNGQGIAAQMALGMLEHFDLAALPIDGPACQHLQIEAMKLAFADVYRFVADPRHMEGPPSMLLDAQYLASRAKLIDPRRAQAFGPGGAIKGGTIYLTAADESGMMVSFIQSNYMGFGSGVVEPTFGISLQNRGHGFSLDAASPNVVAPGKRPFQTIIPGFLSRNGAPVMSFGVMGGNMQPQGHVQTLVRMLDHGQNPQAACDAPRWRFNQGLEINVERQMPVATREALQALGHRSSVWRTATWISAPASSSGAWAIRRSTATSLPATRAATAPPSASELAAARPRPGLAVAPAGLPLRRRDCRARRLHRPAHAGQSDLLLGQLPDPAGGAARRGPAALAGALRRRRSRAGNPSRRTVRSASTPRSWPRNCRRGARPASTSSTKWRC